MALELLTNSGQLPYSEANWFTVLTPDRACMVDSYEVQFVCDDRAWADTVRFGHKGKGPGEIAESGRLVGGPGGMLFHVLAEVPDFGTVYPSEREVEERANALMRWARTTGRPPPTERIEEFRRQPLGRTGTGSTRAGSIGTASWSGKTFANG